MNPQGKIVTIIWGEDPNEPHQPAMDFESYEAAEEVAEENPLCQAWGYQLVNLNLNRTVGDGRR